MLQDSVMGIVAEYNPFHKGHQYQINTAKKILGDIPVVAVMSGSFTQRGEAAFFDKWTRATLALMGGVDLVLELPAIYACRSGETFAQGAIGTLAATGVITHLVFGTETQEPELLAEAATEPINKDKLQEYLQTGLTYGAAVEKLLCAHNKKLTGLLKNPNNILALEYYRALLKLAPQLIPLPIPRAGSGYKDTSMVTTLPSASAIRQELLSHGFTPKVRKALPKAISPEMAESLNSQIMGNKEAYAGLLLAHLLRSSSPEKIKNYCDCSEGLENKIKQGAASNNLEEIIAAIKSRRYPVTRIQRLLCQLLISTEAIPFAQTAGLSPSYIRVLGFNSKGQKLLHKIKETTSLPLVTKLKKNISVEKNGTDFALTIGTEIAATNLYDLLAGNGCYNRDYSTSPVRDYSLDNKY